MSNEERWNAFINELREYIEIHHMGTSRHTDLYNRCHYYRKKMKVGALDEEKVKELEEVLSQRNLSIHTGGRKRRSGNTEN